MKMFSQKKFYIWALSAIMLVAGTHLMRQILYKNFNVHVKLCTILPQLANYYETSAVWDVTNDLIIDKDVYAYKKFTESFSNPIQIVENDYGGPYYLIRIWKTDSGYLVLTTGRDIRHYDMVIRFRKSIDDYRQSQKSDLKTVNKDFLGEY
jgi:hypothetical protein